MSQASVTGTFELPKRATHIPKLVNCNLPNGSNCPLGRVATAVAIFLHPGLPQLIIAVKPHRTVLGRRRHRGRGPCAGGFP